MARNRYSDDDIMEIHSIFKKQNINLYEFCKQNNLIYSSIVSRFRKIGLPYDIGKDKTKETMMNLRDKYKEQVNDKGL